MVNLATVAIALTTGTASACLALVIARLAPALPRGGLSLRAGTAPPEPIAMLFQDRRLVDATEAARGFLGALPGESDWARLWAWLAQRFEAPGLILDRAAADGTATITATGAPAGPGGAARCGAATLRLRADDLGQGLVRLEIVDPGLDCSGVTVNAHSLAAMEDEIAVLRESVDHAPVLIWREDGQGTVTWANAAYLREIEARDPENICWPLPRLIALPEGASAVRRAEIRLDDQPRWFDCHVQAADGHRTIFAVPADGAERAERNLREFVQTLTKTFADLHIGLAIFDRERRLQLFNPALTDLTGLPAAFLTARPTLYAVLDSLREARMIPEPKDYASWRRRMATLEAGAASGHHVETWTLPGGQTYRVTGRPHPGGAIAFLFEDISAEVALTRRFKAELSLGAEVLDALESAVAIFDADGGLLSTNRLFDALWGVDAASTLRGFDRLWRQVAEDSPGYRALRAALSAGRVDGRRSGAIAGPDQALLSWRVRPLSGGRRMVLFARTVAGTGEPIRGDLPTGPCAEGETETRLAGAV
ncbi:PAS-domain containing protein [Paracoccus contaminans]|nr:PAS-domain containing protein [Paracoccus contaminans]